MRGDAQRFGDFLLGHGDADIFQASVIFNGESGSHTLSLVKVTVTAVMRVSYTAPKRLSADITKLNSYF